MWVKLLLFFFYHFGPFKLISICNTESIKQKIIFKKQTSKAHRETKARVSSLGRVETQTDSRKRAKKRPKNRKCILSQRKPAW